jgi:hypothetical protein
MDVNRQFDMKASVKLPEINPETGKKEGIKHNANITIDWTGCTEDDVFWFANRQFKIRAGTALQSEGKPFIDGQVYKAKDYLPGQRVYVKKEMTPEELLALVMANPELLAKIKNAG